MSDKTSLTLLPGLLCNDALWAHQVKTLADIAHMTVADMTRDDTVGAMADRVLAAAPPPPITALGALLGHITSGGDAASYQPMNVNFGLFPPIDTPKGAEKPQVNKKVRGKMRKAAIAERALEGLAEWLREDPPRA